MTREVALKLYRPDGFRDEDVPQLIAQFNDELHKGVPEAVKIFDIYEKACDRLLKPNRTTFIIEEPEQNLFPFTQMDLLEAIVSLCANGREHECTITTHSPFILNYLNVLVKRYYSGVEGKVTLNPQELGAYAISDGRLADLIQVNANSGRLSVNAEDLVEAMRYMYDEYRQMKEL